MNFVSALVPFESRSFFYGSGALGMQIVGVALIRKIGGGSVVKLKWVHFKSKGFFDGSLALGMQIAPL